MRYSGHGSSSAIIKIRASNLEKKYELYVVVRNRTSVVVTCFAALIPLTQVRALYHYTTTTCTPNSKGRLCGRVVRVLRRCISRGAL